MNRRLAATIARRQALALSGIRPTAPVFVQLDAEIARLTRKASR